MYHIFLLCEPEDEKETQIVQNEKKTSKMLF